MLYTDMSNASEFCNQRAIKQRYHIPLARFTPISPYGSYTKFQLDMRRKAEILKYSANKSSAQTNNLTKKQSFALLARGSLQKQSQITLQNNSVDCSVIPMPTTASNVPGPVMYLYEDSAVPLYNYSDYNSRTYPEDVPTDNSMWQVIAFSDVSILSKVQANLFYLIINNSISAHSYEFDLSIPVGISISGIRKSGDFPANMTVSLQFMNLSVYYNNNVVTTIRYPSVGNNTGLNLVFDVSNSSPGAINIAQYLGSLNINGLQLYTEPTYVYSFLASFAITLYSDSISFPNINDLLEQYFDSTGLNIKIVANMSPNTNSLSNCNVSVISGVPANDFNTVNSGASLTEHQ